MITDHMEYSEQKSSGFWGNDFVFDHKTGLFKPKDTGVSLFSVEDLLVTIETASRNLALSMSESAIIDALLVAMEAFTLISDTKGKKYVPVREALNFVSNWVEAIKEKDFEYLTMRRGLCVPKMIDFEEFMESRDYLNQKKSLRPAVKKALLGFYENYDNTIEVVFGGATGIGKTYMAAIVMLFMVYRLSCYHNPQLEFFLAPGTSIVFSVQSASLNLAKKVAFDAIGGLCKQSNYFMQHFMYDKNVRTELRFPKGIYLFPLSGADTAALGLNLFGGCFPAEQEYLRSDGSYGVFGDCETDNILTSDGFSVFDAEAPSQSVCTHALAEIIRLHFDDGSFIDCTPEQRFKNEQNEWVCADAAGGQALLFTSNLSSMQQGGSEILRQAFKYCTWYDDKRIQGFISTCTSMLRKKYGITTTEAETNGRACNLYVMSENFLCNKCDTPESCSQHEQSAISEVVSRGTYGYEKCSGKKSRLLSKTCSRTVEMPQISRECNRGSKETLFGEYEKAGRLCYLGERCRGAGKVSGSTQRALAKNVRRNERAYTLQRGFRQTNCTIFNKKPEALFCLYKYFRSENMVSFPFRVCNRLLFRLLGHDVALRESTYFLENFGRKQKVLSPRFCFRESFYRGKRFNVYGLPCGCKFAYGRKNKAYFIDNSGGTISSRAYGSYIHMDQLKETITSYLQRITGTISTIRCTRIERLKKHIPVFDKKEVQGTHACIVPIKNKEGTRSSKHLIAHNCLDELNFLQVVINSARGGAAGLEGYDQAAGIYNTIITRIKGRFQDKGKIPGKLLLLSSANYPGDFISRKEDEAKESQARYEQTKDAKDRPTIHVIKMSQWESIPEDRFCGDKFLLEVGNENKTTRILRTLDDAVDETDVIEIPVEYISEFRKDPEKSLRDIAGIPVGGKNLFIPYRSKIEDAQLNFEALYPQGQLFLYDSLVMQEILHDMSRPDFSLLINKEHLQELLLDTATPFAAHIDLGITGDAAGLCISRITGYKLVPHTKIYDPSAGSFVEVRDERMPVYTIHGAMQIKHGGGEVDIDALTDFIIYLRQFLNIKYATMDTFQSRTSLQRLKKHGIVVGTVSTDTDQEPYTELRSSLKDDRMLMPRHYVLAHELSTLQRGSDGKIDHPLGTGSKDVSDAAACSCFVLLRREANFATLSRKAVGGIRGSHRMSTGRHIKNNSVKKTGFGGIQSKLSKRRI